MGFARLKIFTLLSLLLAIILMILACITSNRACYDQGNTFAYQKVTNPQVDPQFANDCSFFCNNAPALKLKGTPTTAARTDDYQFPAGRIVRCSWDKTTRHLFLAFVSWAVLWLFIELLLAGYGKFHVIWNLIGLLLFGFAIPTAIYLIDDLHDNNCDNFTNLGFLCYRSIFTISFILMICIIVALFLNLLWNLKNRKKLNNRKHAKQAEAFPPQETVPVAAPIVVNEAPILGQPVSGGSPPVVGADERIA